MSLLVICCLFWGLQQVLVKATLADVPPMLQAAIRFAGATVLLWLWCRLRHVALFEADGSLGAGLLAGALFCSEFVCIYLGLQYTSASRLTLFLYSAPFWVALLLPLRVKAERLRAVQWLGLGVAFASVGVALKDGLQTAHADSHGLSWLGDALALGAGVLWALTTVVIRSTRMATVSAEKNVVLPSGRERMRLALPVLAHARELAEQLRRVCLDVDRGANRDGRLCQLFGVDVVAAPLPRNTLECVCLSHPDLCVGSGRLVAG